jgi:hypothetical protein
MNKFQILKDAQISNETQSPSNPQILKEDQISNETKITNEPQI